MTKIANTIVNIFISINIITALDQFHSNQKSCVTRDFGYGSFVCVCNSTYCDTLLPVDKPPKGHVLTVTSNKERKRWSMQTSSFKSSENDLEVSDIILRINRTQKFQKILGFGGAFTDATGINLRSVSTTVQNYVIGGYFDLNGLEYNMGRVPIAGTDFSSHPYSYDDLPPGQEDPNLTRFSLTDEDFHYKIPFIKQALSASASRGVQLKLFCSPWSGPAWMKTNGGLSGKGRLKEEFYQAWAQYFVRFLREYQSFGISFYALTTQNEPTAGLFMDYPFNEMSWMPQDQGVWIANNLGPELQNSGFGNVTILILDDQRVFLPAWVHKLFENKNASQYVGGIAVHWYWDFITSPRYLDLTHDFYPSLPILYTEACTGWAPWDLKKVVPGSWVRAESYAKDILQNLQHWVVGWTDWNLALNLEGGPNWVENFVDSPVLVNQAEDEVYRQPMYYALAHFSKVIPEGSERVGHIVEGRGRNEIDLVAFIRPDSSTALVMININHFPLSVTLQDNGRSFTLILEPRSIVSAIWSSAQ